MSRNRTYCVLAAGEHTYLWRVRHRHDEGCDEILGIRVRKGERQPAWPNSTAAPAAL